MRLVSVIWVAILLAASAGLAADWPQFRGPSAGVASAETRLPETWSETQNLRWKTALPGAGSSSPVVVGNRVIVTCYSGYGVPEARGSDLESLQRHVVCVDRTTGQVQWTRTIAGELPEDSYQGFLTEHGYASSTPVTDGERIYVFFGKSGVWAFDLAGRELWRTGVGKESSNRRWGSGASLVLHKQTVIVNASEESQSIRALDKLTGREVWKASATALELAYGTPTLVTRADGKTEAVIAVPGEVWGLDADTGKLRWYAEHRLTGNICPSVVAEGETLFVFGGFRSAGSLALRAGGKASPSEMLWSKSTSSYVATPVLHEGHLYWVDDRGQAYCVSARTGELAYRERVAGLSSGGRPVYASPIVAGNKIYVPTRWAGTLVLAARPKYELLAQNRFSGDDSDFNATPAIVDGQLFLRSNRYLYCVGKADAGEASE
jgi:outer membrane protein assembly factor BamB